MQIFVNFWSMGQIGSTINAVSDNIITINCAIWLKEITVPCQMKSSLGQWCAIWAYQKHWLHVYIKLSKLILILRWTWMILHVLQPIEPYEICISLVFLRVEHIIHVFFLNKGYKANATSTISVCAIWKHLSQLTKRYMYM